MSDKSAEEYLELATLGRNVSRLCLERVAAEAASGQLRDAAGAARNAAVVAGVYTDKAHRIQDRPPDPVVHEDPSQSINKLARRLGLTIASPEPAELGERG